MIGFRGILASSLGYCYCVDLFVGFLFEHVLTGSFVSDWPNVLLRLALFFLQIYANGFFVEISLSASRNDAVIPDNLQVETKQTYTSEIPSNYESIPVKF